MYVPLLAETTPDVTQQTLVGGGAAAIVLALALPLIRTWNTRAESADKSNAQREANLYKQIEGISEDNRKLHESLGGLRSQLEAQARSIGELAAKVQMLEHQNSTLLADNQRLAAANQQYAVECVRLKGEVNSLLDDLQKPQKYTL